MGLRILTLLTATLFIALPTPSQQQATPSEPEPRYDAGTTVNTMVVITELREVPRGSPLGGAHLIVKPEAAKSDSETIDVYLAPTDFLKDFECHFAKGDRIEIKGSKVRFSGNAVVLAREVRRDSSTLYLRDSRGVPYWKTGKS